MNIFIQVVLPVILVFLFGFVVQRWKRVDIKPISTVAIFILTPSLIFRTFYTSELNVQHLYMAIFALTLLAVLVLWNKLYVKVRRLPQAQESGLILSTAFMNAGNYGAPIILFAYGEAGFAYAVSYMVLQAIIMSSFGVYYAARGKAGMKMAIRTVFSLPATYVVFLVLLLKLFHISVPANILMTIDIIAEAAIPVVMLILGMQLATIRFERFDWSSISYGVLTRLVLSPVFAYLITLALPFDPLLKNILIVTAAMPSAATIVMYAVQFDAEPKLVSSVTLITTILSVVTITFLLILLG